MSASLMFGPYEMVVFYPRLVRRVRVVRRRVAAVVFVVALAVFWSWLPWAPALGLVLALVLAFTAWCVTAWRHPRAGSDSRLRFRLATSDPGRAEDEYRALARRLWDRREFNELQWLLTSTIQRDHPDPRSWRDPEYYRMHVDILTARKQPEGLAALRVGAAGQGTLDGPVLDDPAERAAVREALRAAWDAGMDGCNGRMIQTYVRLLLADEAHEEAVPVLRQLVTAGWAEHRRLADALRHLGRDAEADGVLGELADIEARRAQEKAQEQAQQAARRHSSPLSSEYRKPSISPAVYGGYGGGGGGG